MQTTLQETLSNGYERLRSGTSLKARIARGTIWLGVGNGMEHGMRFARNMLLTRLIAPEAIGMMAMVMTISGTFDSFTQIGIKEAVIQSPRGSETKYLNGAWWLAFVRGVGLFGVALLLAPYIVHFYHKPGLLPLLQVAFLAIVFNGAMSPRAYVALKEMDYQAWVFIMHGGSICGILTAIVVSLFMPNVWALVIGFTVEAGAQCLLSFIYRPFLPRIKFERELLASLFQYARRTFGLPILACLYARTDVFVLAKYIPDSQLGFYTMALSLAMVPNLLCTTFVTPILMPTLSGMQEDKEMLVRTILRTTRYLAWLFLPGLTLMACLAPLLLSVAYGKPYAAASGPFVFFCGTVGASIIGWGITTTFFAIGRPDLIRLASILRLLAMFALIALFVIVMRLGMLGAAMAGCGSSLVLVGFCLTRLRRAIGLPVSEFMMSLAPGVALSAALVVLRLLAGHWMRFLG